MEKTKKELIELIDKAKGVKYYYSSTWRYPQTGDDCNTCMFLKVMLENEYISGMMVFIPDAKNTCKLQDRNDTSVN
jgi:hypothetical protein